MPEHEVKALLARLGIAVPRGAAVPVEEGPQAVAEAAAGLREPLVLKAYGSGLVHKSDVGAVQLGLAASEAAGAARAMAARVRTHGAAAAGWLIEEQQASGVELIVGRTRGPFGDAMLLGLGGTLAETLDQAVVRLAGTASGAELVDAMPGAEALRGARGAEPVDLDALAGLVDALDALPRAVASAYPGHALDEFECNPVIATKDGAVAVDARLILRRAEDLAAADFAPDAAGAGPGCTAEFLPHADFAPRTELAAGTELAPRTGLAPRIGLVPGAELAPRTESAPRTDFAPLFAPRTVAVAGASTTKTTFGNRFLAAYRSFGRTEGLYAIHPSAREIDGVPAVPSPADVPGGIDYLLVAVPAAATPALLTAAAGHVRFAHVVSGGFREAGDAALEAELLAAARRAGVRLLGPNCLGVYAPAGRQTFQLGAEREAGTIGVVSQSGGLAGDIVAAGTRRGLRFSGLVTIGNAADVGAAELVEHFADDPGTRVIGMYLEGTGGGERLARAVRRAAHRGKPVVALVGGLSRQGARAAASHTGALAGDERMWGALATASGMTVVRTLEDFLAVLALLQRHPAPASPSDAGPGVLVVGPGGGASVLATDACDRAGLEVGPLPAPAAAVLRGRGYGAGTSLANPVEIPLGPATGPDAFARVLDAVLPDAAYGDVLMHVNVQSYYGYADTGAVPLLALVADIGGLDRHGVRLSLVLRNLDCAPAADAEAVLAACAGSGIPVFRDLDQAATAIAAVRRLQSSAARGEFAERLPDVAHVTQFLSSAGGHPGEEL
ncbi:acetate--CoA ligase family protein [Yinghuangia sp. KLBMP8922]|uniref:Acetate--CoA ligase family protein n=1 Tax=Yinghuangia soli TaxID=2908204 RepID=A0AA41Q442_9ACTN|nr:acetate--CoA ligase family protein [Yinghuangia soli]MCF2530857.1 acetate--CoA ligase family protein [Yinghuangia soli]